MAPLVGLVASIGLLLGCQDLKPIKGKGRVAPATRVGGAAEAGGEKVKVEMYVMSKCPHGVRAVDAFKPVLDELGQYIDFQLDYIVRERNGQITSMHGQPELDGDVLQLCAMKHYPQRAKWMGFISCQNRTWRQIPRGWEACANQNGMDVGKMKSCFQGSEGKELIRASMKRARAAGARGSPTIKVAGKPFRGRRHKTGFVRAVCQAITGDRPKPCANVPPAPKEAEPVPVSGIVLTDKRCKKCNPRRMIATLKSRFFRKLTIRTVYYDSDEGKKLYKELGLKMLPVYLFEEGVKKSPNFRRLRRWMRPLGKYQSLKVPAKFDPTAEICDNKKDDTGNGKVDCADPDCSGFLGCRKEKKGRVDLFIMSQCPFGVKAVNAMKEVLPNFKNKIKFDIHYIAKEDPKKPLGFSSMHGAAEVREDIRQLCAKKHYARNNKYLDYLWCRFTGRDWRTEEWKKCAKGGIQASVIEKCANGPEGKKLLAKSAKFTNSLKFGASPTWLANNKFKFSGIAPEPIKRQICRHNPKLPNCDKKLTSKSAGPAASCGK